MGENYDVPWHTWTTEVHPMSVLSPGNVHAPLGNQVPGKQSSGIRGFARERMGSDL